MLKMTDSESKYIEYKRKFSDKNLKEVVAF